ncbi:hypothetical protein RSAG8_04561, partial [Rhizoctonia solani AG-8 WAC10335]
MAVVLICGSSAGKCGAGLSHPVRRGSPPKLRRSVHQHPHYICGNFHIRS